MNAKDADVVIFVYDITRKSTFLNISQWYQTTMENCKKSTSNRKPVFLIVGNMADQASGRMVTTQEGETFAKENNMLFFECSAKTDTELDKKILLMIAKEISASHSRNNSNGNSSNGTTTVENAARFKEEWIFSALLRNDHGQTIPVTISYSRKMSNLTIRREQQKSILKVQKDIFMSIELSATNQMHYCMNSKTILILENDLNMEQKILWTCSIVNSEIPFADLIVSLVFEAKVLMIEICEFGSVSDVLATYTKQCVLMKEIPSPAIINQFQMMNTNVNLELDLSNFSFFQTSKQKMRPLQIQAILEPIKWTYGMISILNLEDAWLGDMGIEILCNCLQPQCIFQLRVLKLSNNEITEAGTNCLKALFSTHRNLVMVELDVSNNPLIRAQGCKKIVEIAKSLTKLRFLGLSNCGATNEVASQLVEVLNTNRHLKVNLANSSINQAVSDIILALPEDCLKNINFSNNAIMHDTRISTATMNQKNQSQNGLSKVTGNKIIIDLLKVQLYRRIMNSVSIFGETILFQATLKTEEKTNVKIRVFNWLLEEMQRADAMKSVLQDMTSLSKVEHSNCIKYYGLLCPDFMTPPNTLNIVIEEFGIPLSYALYIFLLKLTFKEKVTIAYDIAVAIQYLHSLNYLHLNLSSDSISILKGDDGVLRTKVAYYGLTKWIQKGYIEEIRNPIYQSPELLKSKGKTGGTQKSDVYAFSVLLWELWYCRRPYSTEELYYKNRKELLRQIADIGKRPELPSISENSSHANLEKRLQSLMHKCWQHDATLRPDFKFICIALKDIVESL